MADIELVIKIPEEDYERLKEYKKAPFYSLTSRVYEAIANGTSVEADTRGDMLTILSRGRKPKRACLLEALAEEDTQIIALAYAHAQYLKMFGVDIEKAIDTATESAEVIAKAYQRGYYDAMEKERMSE